MQWIATVAPASGQSVASVAFVVDGKTQWTEVNAPYYFNDDKDFLYPWLFTPGKHTFGLNVTMVSGKKITESFPVTTMTETVPSALVGTWSRTVIPGDFTVGDNTPDGLWKITVGANGMITMADPTGNHQVEAFSATSTGITMQGTVNWLVPANEQGGFCDPELPADYTWQRSGSTLTLASTKDVSICQDRNAVFHGTWALQG